jgi:hypothetical protein
MMKFAPIVTAGLLAFFGGQAAAQAPTCPTNALTLYPANLGSGETFPPIQWMIGNPLVQTIAPGSPADLALQGAAPWVFTSSVKSVPAGWLSSYGSVTSDNAVLIANPRPLGASQGWWYYDDEPKTTPTTQQSNPVAADQAAYQVVNPLKIRLFVKLESPSVLPFADAFNLMGNVQLQNSPGNLSVFTNYVAAQAAIVRPPKLGFVGLTANIVPPGCADDGNGNLTPACIQAAAQILVNAINATRYVTNGIYLDAPGGGLCPSQTTCNSASTNVAIAEQVIASFPHQSCFLTR